MYIGMMCDMYVYTYMCIYIYKHKHIYIYFAHMKRVCLTLKRNSLIRAFSRHNHHDKRKIEQDGMPRIVLWFIL